VAVRYELGQNGTIITTGEEPPVSRDVVMLPPYVAPEHQALLDDAQKLLDFYCEVLAQQLEPKGTEYIKPDPSEYAKARKAFLTDPMRQRLIANLAHIKALVERPQFLIKA
jgi:hypothetical protein